MISALGRIPSRVHTDLRIIGLLKNWPEALVSKLTRSPLHRLRFRNGVAMDAPDRGQLDFLLHEIWLERVYSPPGYEIGPQDVVIDVGANLGTFTLFAASQSPGVRVYAYEPSPEVFAYLQQNVRASGLSNVEALQLGLAGEGGEHGFVDGVTRLSGSVVRDASAGRSIRCCTLDDVFTQHRLSRCDLLKIDCEGAEYEILDRCAPETLAKIRRMVGEFHVGSKGDASRLRGLLERHGWRIDVLAQGGPEWGTFCATNRAA